MCWEQRCVPFWKTSATTPPRKASMKNVTIRLNFKHDWKSAIDIVFWTVCSSCSRASSGYSIIIKMTILKVNCFGWPLYIIYQGLCKNYRIECLKCQSIAFWKSIWQQLIMVRYRSIIWPWTWADIFTIAFVTSDSSVGSKVLVCPKFCTE